MPLWDSHLTPRTPADVARVSWILAERERDRVEIALRNNVCYILQRVVPYLEKF